MNKVSIEITTDGWAITVHLDGKAFTQKMELRKGFGFKSTENGLSELEASYPELMDALVSFTYQDIWEALFSSGKEGGPMG